MNDNTSITIAAAVVAVAVAAAFAGFRSCTVEINQSNNNAIVDCVGKTSDPLACAQAVTGK